MKAIAVAIGDEIVEVTRGGEAFVQHNGLLRECLGDLKGKPVGIYGYRFGATCESPRELVAFRAPVAGCELSNGSIGFRCQPVASKFCQQWREDAQCLGEV